MEEFRHSISIDAPLVRSSSRLEAYSDALFSIVATVMVLPVSHTELPEDESLSSSFVRLLLPKILAYIYTFIFVCNLWTNHVKLFDVIEMVDEFSVLLNLAMMMTITFFPFSFTLLGLFPMEDIAVQIFCGSMAVLCGARGILIWHVFSNPEMIRDEIKENDEQNSEKKLLYSNTIIVFILSVLAFILSFFIVGLAWLCLLVMIFEEALRSLIFKLYNKFAERDQEVLATFVPWRKRLLSETVSKERLEFFSDGVFAIVATLIILDICEDNVPTVDSVQKAGSLAAALGENPYIFLAYAGSFVTVALQWYVHHSIVHYTKEITKLMMVFNFLCLMTVGMSPMAFKLTSNFDKHEGNNNEAIAIQVNSTVILLTGLFQSCFWIVALFHSQRCLAEESWHGGKDHVYMACKIAVLPLGSLVMFFLSLIPDFRVTIFVGVQIGGVGVYVLLGLLHTQMRKRRRKTNAVAEQYERIFTLDSVEQE